MWKVSLSFKGIFQNVCLLLRISFSTPAHLIPVSLAAFTHPMPTTALIWVIILMIWGSFSPILFFWQENRDSYFYLFFSSS